IERAWIDEVLKSGFIDTFRAVNGDVADAYSWWSYRFNARAKNVGWRIDYFFISQGLKDRLKDAFILPEIAGSDHCPVGIEIEI
ncbi:MAG: exodeoxyribonuclease III, partial [Campylobacter concisus]|nr:exodeoxyribonuclease III [Campylobacter concisus]